MGSPENLRCEGFDIQWFPWLPASWLERISPRTLRDGSVHRRPDGRL